MKRRDFLKAAPLIPVATFLGTLNSDGDLEVKGQEKPEGFWLATVDREWLEITPHRDVRHVVQAVKKHLEADTMENMIVPSCVTIKWVGKT